MFHLNTFVPMLTKTLFLLPHLVSQPFYNRNAACQNKANIEIIGF